MSEGLTQDQKHVFVYAVTGHLAKCSCGWTVEGVGQTSGWNFFKEHLVTLAVPASVEVERLQKELKALRDLANVIGECRKRNYLFIEILVAHDKVLRTRGVDEYGIPIEAAAAPQSGEGKKGEC